MQQQGAPGAGRWVVWHREDLQEGKVGELPEERPQDPVEGPQVLFGIVPIGELLEVDASEGGAVAPEEAQEESGPHPAFTARDPGQRTHEERPEILGAAKERECPALRVYTNPDLPPVESRVDECLPAARRAA